MAAGTYSFIAPVLRRDTGMRAHYIPVPDDVADALQAVGVRRLIATFNGLWISRALQGSGDGERYVLLGLALLRDIGARMGDLVEVVLEADPHPDRIDLGEELTAVLELDEQAATRFAQFTPGRRRSLAYYVNSAKRTETRISRALELAHKLKTHSLYSDR